jgi:hypothetical protein
MADSDVEVQFGGDAEGALASMSQVRFALQGLTAPIRGIRDNLGELAEAFVAAFAIEKIAGFVEAMGQLGLQTQRTGAMLGLSAEQVGVFQGVAALTGTSTETLTNGIERMSLNIQKSTRDSFNPAAQGLRALGLSAKELISIPTDQWYGKLADAVSKFNPSLNLTNALMAVGGRGVAQMLPLLQQGSAGFNAFAEDVKKTGDVLTEAQAGAFTKMHEGITLLGMSVKGVGITLMTAFAPAVNVIVGALTDLIEWFNKSIQSGGTFKGLLDLLVIAADAVAVAILTVVYTIEAVVQTVDFALREIRDLISGNLGAAKKDMESWQSSIEESAKGWLARMKALIGSGTAAPGAGGGPKQDAGAIDMSGRDQLGAAEKAIDGQIKLWEEWLKRQTSIYAEDAKTFGITQDRKYALTEAATEKAYQAELALLQKEAALGGMTVSQRQEVDNKILELEAKHQTDMQKLNAESVASMQKQWEGYFETIEGAFNSNLRGLLAGTTSWKVAMEKTFGDLIIKFIETVEKMVAQWIAAEIAKTVATQTGVAARTAAENTGSIASIISAIAGAIKAISAGAGQTAAGVSANVAPAVGPAAPAVGAAAGATVMATAMSYIHAETGAWEVGGGAAMLHPGEMVIPKPFAESLRDAGGGGFGGGAPTIHISAVDAQSVKNLLQSNSDTIGGIVKKYAKSNPSSMRGS